MTSSYRRAGWRPRVLSILAFCVALSCSSTTEPEVPVPVLTTINVVLPAASIATGQTITATTSTLDQNGAAIGVSTMTWASTVPTVATVDAAGVIAGVSAGTSQIIATFGGRAGQQAITVTAPPAIKINEVESSGGTPGDWVELFNPTSASVDVSGWKFRDNDTTHLYGLPAASTIPAGGYLVLDEAAFGFGLGAADDARLYTQFGVPIDSYTWTAHATTTYGRCPNGSGAFATTVASTKGATNSCTPPAPVISPWPGSDDVQTVDGVAVFGSNLSGLTYEAASSGKPAVLWAVRNGPGTLYRLIFSGGIWTPDPADDWGVGKTLHYTDNLGNTDAEGVTYAAGGSAGGIYVSTERNNDASTVSKNSVLRFDPAQTGAVLRATNEWDITSDLPVVGANLGIEAVTWIPDSALVANKFYDETAAHAYAPSEYPDHGTGLFFVGVEANGIIYAYALNHANNSAKRIATFTSGNAGVMGLEYDRETGYLWAVCDDGCGGTLGILEIDTRTSSATLGRFLPPRQFARPPSMPNLNNEGFALAPQSECVSGRKAAFWSDDGETGGHSIRRASIQCGAIVSAATSQAPGGSR